MIRIFSVKKKTVEFADYEHMPSGDDVVVVFKTFDRFGYRYKAVSKKVFDSYVSKSYDLKNHIVKVFRGPQSKEKAQKMCDHFNESETGDYIKIAWAGNNR